MKIRVAAAIMLSAVPACASAQQIVLNPTNIVGASSVYFGGAGNQGDPFAANGARVNGVFGAGNIFNSQLDDPTVEGFFSGSYFLTGDGQSQATVSNPYITIDLGRLFSLSSFTLFNSNNGNSNDRGTGGFTLRGSNSLLADGANGFTLGDGAVMLASGTLAPNVAGAPPLAQSFGAATSAGVRYLQFVPTSVGVANPFNAQAYGLNELKVFGTEVTTAVPEPATWAMILVGFATIGLGMRRRQAQDLSLNGAIHL